MKKTICLCAICLLIHSALFAQPGSLDSSFSKDGIVKIKIGNLESSTSSSIAIQSNNKIVIAGSTYMPGETYIGLVRYNPNGMLDHSFGNNGQVTTHFNEVSVTTTSLLLLNDETIIVGGYSGNGSVMVKYKKSGLIDSTFGVNGEVNGDFPGAGAGILALAQQTDGKIIAAGRSGGNFTVARYYENGKLDSAFGINGLAITNIGQNTMDNGKAVAIQNDGKIIVAGNTIDKYGLLDAVLIRYKKNGQLDHSFGNNGIVVTDLGSRNDFYRSLVIQPNGKINAAGAKGLDFHLDFVVAQYNNNGTLDSSFGTNGLTSTDFGSTDDQANAISLQSNGEIVLAGSNQSWDGLHYTRFALARYKPNATLDSTFGVNGKLTTDFGSDAPDLANAIVIQPDGKIAVTGNSGSYAAIARYNADSSNLHFSGKNNFTNIQTGKSTTISLSPNPVKDVLNIQGMSAKKKTIEIMNASGSIMQRTVTSNNNYAYSTNQLKAGIYLVKIIEGEHITILKFVRE